MSDEYELLPADELEKLRREVDELKAHPLGESEQGKDLLHAVQQLTVSINKLLKAFSDAEQSMAKEYEDMKTVGEHLNELHDENEKIASGVVSVASLLGGLEESNAQEQQQPSLPAIEEPPVQQQPLTPQPSTVPDLLSTTDDPFAVKQEDDPFAPKEAEDPFARDIEQPVIEEPQHHPAMPPPPPPPKKKRGLF